MSTNYEEEFLKKLSLESGDTFVHLPLEPHTSTHRSIRLIYLHPSPDRSSTSPISCTLQHVNLLSASAFKALSYVWGDSSLTLPILINGKPYHVTANCHAALHRLRDIGERAIWIDAICINQQDDGEKAAQISMMADIYSAAREVIVWLGRGEVDRSPDDEVKEHLAFSLIERFDPEGDKGALDAFWDFVRTAVRANPLGDDLKALSWMLNHPWFTRLWVLQEVVVSRQALVLGQYQSLDFVHILLVVAIFLSVMGAEIVDKSRPLDAEFNRLVNGCRVASERGALKLQYDCKDRWEEVIEKVGLEDLAQPDTLAIMSRSRQYKCLDPRDRVFAILRMLKDGIKHGIAPDYRVSVSHLYATLTVAIVTEREDLDVLRLAGLGTPRGVHDPPLPSWVVDWHSDPKSHLFLWQELYQASPKDWNVSMVHFGGCPGPSPTLTVPGMQIDTVLDTPTPDVPETVSTRSVDGLSLWKDHFKSYPTGCDPNHAWVRTITADLDDSSLDPKRLDEQTVLQYDFLAKLDRGESYTVEGIVNAFPKDGLAGDEWLRRFRFMKAVFKKAHVAALKVGDRIFFITKKGYMGIGPRVLEKGDAICVMPGCKVPLLLREEENHHLMVGECFVWGLMDGEAFDGNNGEYERTTFLLR